MKMYVSKQFFFFHWKTFSSIFRCEQTEKCNALQTSNVQN